MGKSSFVIGLALALVIGASAAPVATARPTTTPAGNGLAESSSSTPTAQITPHPTTSANSTNGTAQNRTGPCTGIGGIGGAVCTGMQKGVGTLVTNLVDQIATVLLTKLQSGAETVIQLLVSRPVPLRDSDIALAGEPTNPPMTTVYALWLNMGLPAGLGIWALSMLLLRMTAFLPSSAAPVMEAKTKLLEGWITLFRILASWIWCALVLHLTLGMAQAFAPPGEAIITSFESLGETAAGAGVAALVVYLSSGVLFLLVVVVFGLSFLAPFVLMPAYPLFVGLSLPNVWVFEWFAQKGEFLRSLFAPAAFMPVPTAVILGAGYPILNAIRGQLSGPLASIVGVPTYIVLLLVMWFAALLAPLFLFVGGRKMRPLQMFAAGALGAATATNVSQRASNLRERLGRPSFGSDSSGASVAANAGAGRSVDPLEGSPFSRENGGGFGGRLGATDGPEIAGTLGEGGSTGSGGGGPPASVTSPSAGAAGSASTSTSTGSASTSSDESGSKWDRITSRPTQAYADSVPDGIEFEKATTRMELEQDQYNAGYFMDDGEFKSVSQGNSNSGWLLDEGGLKRVSRGHEDDPVLLYDESNNAAYDARSIVQEGEYQQGRYERQHQDSVRAVQETQL